MTWLHLTCCVHVRFAQLVTVLSTFSLTGTNSVDVSHCKCLVAIITSAYLNSSYCSDELFVADSNCKPIFPVIFEDVNFELLRKLKRVKDVIGGLCWSFFRPKVDNYDGSLNWLVQRMSQNGERTLKQVTSLPLTYSAWLFLDCTSSNPIEMKR